MATKRDREIQAKRDAEAMELAGFELIPPELAEKLKAAAFNYEGRADHIEVAIGAVVMARMYGWRAVRLLHHGTTYARIERALGFKIKDHCPERGILARRSNVLALADQLGNFWAMARGTDTKPEHRLDATTPTGA